MNDNEERRAEGRDGTAQTTEAEDAERNAVIAKKVEFADWLLDNMFHFHDDDLLDLRIDEARHAATESGFLEWFHNYFDAAAEEYRQLMAFFERAVGDARTLRCSCGQDHDTGIQIASDTDRAAADDSSWAGVHVIGFEPRD